MYSNVTDDWILEIEYLGKKKINGGAKIRQWKKNEGLDGRVEDGKAEKGKKGKTILLS